MKNTTDTIICPLCGVSRIMEVPENASEEEREKYIIEVCDCQGAEDQRRRDSVKDKIDMLFGSGSEQHGFDASLEQGDIETIMDICAFVLSGKVISATITLPSGDKCKIATFKGRVKVVHECKRSAEAKI